jgi:hypothetical protein
MQSWSLKKFIKDHDENTAAVVWGVTQQAVNAAVNNESRDINIILVDDVYEVVETKLLRRIHKRFLSI